MSAQIISFPRMKPLEDHEMPPHWSDSVRWHYGHATYDGFRTHEEAFAHCEQLADAWRKQATN